MEAPVMYEAFAEATKTITGVGGQWKRKYS
jgi:hypothetical protein